MFTGFERVSIIGLGLIGGSWGLALKRQGFQGRIVGCDRPEALRQALDLGAIDEAGDAAAAVRGAGLVVVATPVGAILELLPRLQEAAASQALVTDTGSTKRAIVKRAREVFGGGPLFLGGHPLAGKEGSGLDHADGALFEKTHYALTPLASADWQDARVQAFAALVKGLGARPFVVEADVHDRALALLSHLPQLLSTALAGLAAEERAEDRLPLELAAAGFRDMTRLARSPYTIWRDICLTNADNIGRALESLIGRLEVIKTHLADRGLEGAFEEARRLHEQLSDSSEAFRFP